MWSTQPVPSRCPRKQSAPGFGTRSCPIGSARGVASRQNLVCTRLWHKVLPHWLCQRLFPGRTLSAEGFGTRSYPIGSARGGCFPADPGLHKASAQGPASLALPGKVARAVSLCGRGRAQVYGMSLSALMRLIFRDDHFRSTVDGLNNRTLVAQTASAIPLPPNTMLKCSEHNHVTMV